MAGIVLLFAFNRRKDIARTSHTRILSSEMFGSERLFLNLIVVSSLNCS